MSKASEFSETGDHKKIYTLGTGRRSEEDFMEILFDYDIKVLADVRSYPRSKLPHFRREYLEDLLRKEGIEYIYLGKELGGFRKGGYEAYTSTEDFMRGVGLLEVAALRGNAVFICAEHFPWKCHRRWIARELHRRGWLIEHIIDKDKVWVPK